MRRRVTPWIKLKALLSSHEIRDMHGFARQNIDRGCQPGMRRTSRSGRFKRVCRQSQAPVTDLMTTPMSTISIPGVTKNRSPIGSCQQAYVPERVAEPRSRAFGQDTINERNGAAHAAQDCVSPIAGEMRVDRQIGFDAPVNCFVCLAAERYDRPWMVGRRSARHVDVVHSPRHFAKREIESVRERARIAALVAVEVGAKEGETSKTFSLGSRRRGNEG